MEKQRLISPLRSILGKNVFSVFLVPSVFSVMALISCASAANAASPVSEDGWYTRVIQVVGLPGECRFVVVSQRIDFTAILAELHVTGAVDTHSLRLVLVGPDKREQSEPAQWTSDFQPRPKAPHLMPSTTRSVSYIGEHAADAAPPVRVSGTLAWVVRPGQGAERHYLLKFRVPRGGRFVQVPFLPQDLHAFDADAKATSPPFPLMQIHPQWPVDGMVDLFQGPTRVLGYHIGPTSQSVSEGSIRRPFMYPVIGPDGIPLTEFGKPHDPAGSHAHHYSLWIAHSSVDGHDFWSEKGGAIVHSRLEEQEDGPVFCRLVQSTQWMWENSDLLHERRTITLYNTPDDFRLIDVDLEFTPAGKEPVTFGKSTFGFLATRVRQSMTVFDGGGEILNSHADRNEQNVHLKHADWIDVSGPIAPDKWGGIAILDHPSNPNHPSMFHCRNDGWACASFSGEAPYMLESGKALHLRYRVVLHRGNATEGEIAQHFTDYATAPTLRTDPH